MRGSGLKITEEFWSLDDVAVNFGVCLGTVHQWRYASERNGFPPAIAIIGRRVPIFSTDAVREWGVKTGRIPVQA